MISLVCTAFESARRAGLSFIAEQAQEAAVESVFAGYYRPLLDDYHLLFMADSSNLEDTLTEYLSYYGDVSKESRAGGRSLYGFTVEEVSVIDAVTAVDDAGAAFTDAVREDAVLHGFEEAAEELTGQAKLAEESEAVYEYIDSLGEYGDEVADIEGAYSAVESQGERLREKMSDLDTAIENEELTEGLVDEAKELAADVLAETQAEYDRMQDTIDVLQGELADERDRLKEQEETLSDASCQWMEEELANLEVYTDPSGGRRTELEEMAALVGGEAQALIDAEAWEDGEVSETFSATVREGSLTLPRESEEETFSGGDGGLLQAVKNWAQNGILALVLPGSSEISEGSFDTAPYLSELSEAADASGPALAALYMTEHFGYYGEEKEDTVLAYETEYILAGHDSDRDNLATVAEELIGVRTGMNFIYLLSDSAKRAEAGSLAAIMTAGIYPLTVLVEGLLLGAWALAEAVSDVQRLFAGETVPFIKTSSDWQLSLDNAASIFTGGAQERKDTASSSGFWDYEGYLQLLFLIGNTGRRCFRMMDLIEANLRQDDPGFFMENCICSMTAEATFRGSSGRTIQKTAAYAY